MSFTVESGVQAQVCVVGGGPAGLTLALELARRSVSVVVVEQSARFDIASLPVAW
ncbi:FAD-dependent oxidoreductase [Streptomyces sp. NPDC056309]|uniref:FAD-dependent oxidoreductase n=1 Tax=unclassified Streptomyces TaxID=2593676 RepID=UPI0035E36732